MQDTYYVVAHFHYVLVAGSLFALFTGFYYWAPKWTGHMYNERRGKIHFWNSMIWINVSFFPMHFLGLAGMPRRYADYPAQFTDFNLLTSIGAFAFGLTQVYFVFEKQNIAFMVPLAFAIAASANFPVLFMSVLLWKGCTTRGATIGGFLGLDR